MARTTLISLAALAALSMGGIAQAATTVVAPADWLSMIPVASSNPTGQLRYELDVAADQPLSISATFMATDHKVVSAYPGDYGSAGYISVIPACLTDCGTEGNIAFYMAKPPGAEFAAGHAHLLIGGQGIAYYGDEVGSYVPGASYDITMTWNRAAGQIDISVVGAGSSFSQTVSSTADRIVGLGFAGPQLAGTSSFGNVMVAVPEPGSWLMLAVGLGAVGFLGYRRQQAA